MTLSPRELHESIHTILGTSMKDKEADKLMPEIWALIEPLYTSMNDHIQYCRDDDGWDETGVDDSGFYTLNGKRL